MLRDSTATSQKTLGQLLELQRMSLEQQSSLPQEQQEGLQSEPQPEEPQRPEEPQGITQEKESPPSKPVLLHLILLRRKNTYSSRPNHKPG